MSDTEDSRSEEEAWDVHQGSQGNVEVHIDTRTKTVLHNNGEDKGKLDELRKLVDMSPLEGNEVIKYASEPCVAAIGRQSDDGRDLPDIIFPKRYLGQKEMTADELKSGADWFVYKIDTNGEVVNDVNGKPVFNDFFRHIKDMTVEKKFPLVDLLSGFANSKFVKSLMLRFDIRFPYYESPAMIEIAKVAFSSTIRPEFGSEGSQYFYKVIGPVYEFFHQMNTQAVQSFKSGEFKQIGNLPLSLISVDNFSNTTEYLPNDATGRDLLSIEISQKVKDGATILGVGDGPALTSLKIANQLLEQGKTNIEIKIFEYNDAQIKNGKRAFAELPSDLRTQLDRSGIRINWIQGDASNMHTIAENSVDIVFSTYVVGAMGGKVHGPSIVAGYGREAARVLKNGGEHITLDFYLDGRDMNDGYIREDMNDDQQGVRGAYKLLRGMVDGPLKSCYEGIWDHLTWLNDNLVDASREAGLKWSRSHRQTWFGHLPIIRIGNRVLAASVPGYDEITNRFVK